MLGGRHTRTGGGATRAGAAAAGLLAAVLLALGLAGGGQASASTAQRPNVVVIQTDDQTLAQLTAHWLTPLGLRARVMPNTLDLLRDQGVTFSRYYASYPLCCPSRSTLLSGRYAHSHGVIANEPPRGGWSMYQQRAIYRHNLAVWLQDAGYRTIHLGKFINHYGGAGKDDPTTVVPPGWNSWQTIASDNAARRYYGYVLNVDGTIEGPFGSSDYADPAAKDAPGCPQLGACNYQADLLTERAVEQIDISAPGRPFYLQIDYSAPHGDIQPPIGPEPAPRHYDSAIDTPLPKPPSFNESDVSDKPSFIRDEAEYLDSSQTRRIRIEYQKSLEALRSVDDGVGQLIAALGRNRELSNTYVIFISDNGFFFGEHRLERAKFLPYESAVRMPLLVRGPGIEPGSVSGELAGNIDIAPTILRLTGASATRGIDGRSLVRFWRDPSLRTRRPILFESFVNATNLDGVPGHPTPRGGAGPSIAAPLENYLGVRLGRYTYIEYETGDRELYDLLRDPYQLESRHRSPRYDRVQGFLRRQIERLEGCRGIECRITTGPVPEPGLPPPPGRR